MSLNPGSTLLNFSYVTPSTYSSYELSLKLALPNKALEVDWTIILLEKGSFVMQYGNLWRTAGDITQSWPEIMRVLDSSVGLMKYSKPHGWADMDMLEVGCF